MKWYFTIVLIISQIFTGFAQAELVDDSLAIILNSNSNDSGKIVRLTTLGRSLSVEPKMAMEILTELINFTDKLKSKKDISLAYRKIGTIYADLHNNDKAIEYTLKALEIQNQLNDKQSVANCLNNLANFYRSKGELTGDTILFSRAVDYMQRNIAIRKEINDTVWLKLSYNNLATIYLASGEYEKAISILNIPYEYFKKKPGHDGSHMMVCINYGDAYLGLARKTGKAEYFRKALWYYNDLENRYFVNKDNITRQFADVMLKSGEVYLETDQLKRADEHLNKAYFMYAKMKDNSGMSKAAKNLAELYGKQHDYKRSNEYFELYVSHKDTMLNSLNRSNIEQMQMIYQTSQKDKQIEKLKTDKALQKEKLNKQRTITIASIVGVVLLLSFGVVLLRSNRLKRKANLRLTHAYQNIEFKNKQITESINYAKRIQNAILPPEELLRSELNDFFIYYSPKDIVSGDFYWFTKHNGNVFFAVADCTGHGVPGALMSMVGNTLLHEIVDQKNITMPGEILMHLNNGITNALRQQNTDVMGQDDGMDISIITFSEKNRQKIKYASANHAIFVKENGQLKELSSDVFSIGGSIGVANKCFETFECELKQGSHVIMSTDGYYDQFGGEKNSKYLISRFEKFILANELHKGSGADLEKEMALWKTHHKQTDDILVAGFRV